MHPRDILRSLQFRDQPQRRARAVDPCVSRIQHLAAVAVGASLSVRARVTANYEHKGHRFVEVDALVLADEAPVAHVAHLAIYQPRQVVGA